MGATVGVWEVGDKPVRAKKQPAVGLEKDLEEWIASDASLLSEGIQIVGRQVSLEGGFLDLLAIDAGGRWLAIELKRGRLYREAVAQALDYSACLRRIGAEELRERLMSGLEKLSDPVQVSAAIQEQLDSEEDREVAVVLVGTGVDAGLERVVEYLGGYNLPVSVISFEVFVLADGSQLLVREVIEEQVKAQSEQSKTKSLDDLRRQASRFGVGPDFNRLVAAAEDAGLYVRPYVQSVMLAPASARYRFLMAARPQTDGRMRLSYGPDAFAEFYPELTAEDVAAAIGGDEVGIYEANELTDRVSAFVEFLAELPQPQEAGSGAGGSADTATVLALAACIHEGEWTTYGDISTAATGSSSAAMAVGNIARTNADFPSPHRILNRDGKVPSQWTDGLGGGPEVCRTRLEAEGVTFRESGAADDSSRVTPTVLRSRAEVSEG